MARTAGGVDHAHLAKAELADGRCERAVENELFHKLGRLQQSVALARGFAQVLVQVTQEAGVPSCISEVVQQRAGVGVHLLPKLAHGHGGVATDAQPEGRVVGFVEKSA